MTPQHDVLEKIKRRTLTVGVVGLGYVGLPTALAFVEAGFHVEGAEANPLRAMQLDAGLPGETADPEQLRRALASGRFSLCRSAAQLTTDAVIICVPTPLRHEQDPDVRAIEQVVDQINARTQPVVVLVSTTYPGCTSEMAERLVHGLRRRHDRETRLGHDFFVGHAPERIDPGRDVALRYVPRVVGGESPACGEVLHALFGAIHDHVVRVRDSRTAEMVKCLENTYRAVNIALANETAAMCDTLGIRSREVIDAAATKPYGFQAFYPGPGPGGHCIPLDPRYLEHRLRELGYFSPMISAALRVNAQMPRYVGGRVARLLNTQGKPVKGSRVHVLGVAYKANTSDCRESPALEIIEWLRHHGAIVSYHDPLVPRLALRHGQDLFSTPTAAERCDLLLIATAHNHVPHHCASLLADATFDARGAIDLDLGTARREIEQL